MLLCNSTRGPVFQNNGAYFAAPDLSFDALFNHSDLMNIAKKAVAGTPLSESVVLTQLIGSQEVWAAGVTYFRSRSARMEESQDSGGADFYDRVYKAERPELFFKATPSRVVAPEGKLQLRSDSKWMVPEPELTLAINNRAEIIGFTVGNDLSCRDIEGENPLYLPQAKVFSGCAAMGPGILLQSELLPPSTEIKLMIYRDGRAVTEDKTELSQLKKPIPSLVSYLFRDNVFAQGCFLMTGTGIVPSSDFTLKSGDRVEITIEPIGTLRNTIA
ncbi:MAG: fumarylacetoacetate hydrolase family protein [Polyangiaceae bacterium]|nr:fumarylacetoacetate hydrolase family protein [Polyangiaceae bacterium]